MRLALILIVVLWGTSALVALAKSRDRSSDAKLTAAYFLLWPALVALVILNTPVPLWIAVPVVFGFIPWFLSGPHLWAILKDPSQSRPDELIGIPKAYWGWGGLGAFLLGLVFG
ncbi:MAG: hypothetical protein MUC77_18790 [Chromatiaceae bacterium]|jgi:hypothetical protein|nr:hypothetical protein [Chromatiaceae bacterium]